MQLTRTTVRLNPTIKKAAQTKAIDMNVSLQDLFNKALENYLQQLAEKKAEKLVFHSQDMRVKLDKLSREDIYAD